MKVTVAEAVPLHALLSANGNGHALANGNGNGNGNGHAAEAVLTPRLTAQGLRKLLERENNPCGPGLLVTRLRAVKHAQEQGEAKLLAGALEDLAAAAVGYSYRVRARSHIWPKAPPPAK